VFMFYVYGSHGIINGFIDFEGVNKINTPGYSLQDYFKIVHLGKLSATRERKVLHN